MSTRRWMRDLEIDAAPRDFPPAAPPSPRWRWVASRDTEFRHAFPLGPGWMRSACGTTRWTVLFDDEREKPRCPECITATAEAVA